LFKRETSRLTRLDDAWQWRALARSWRPAGRSYVTRRITTMIKMIVSSPTPMYISGLPY
jgi:hypothetical protein